MLAYRTSFARRLGKARGAIQSSAKRTISLIPLPVHQIRILAPAGFVVENGAVHDLPFQYLLQVLANKDASSPRKHL